MAPDTSSASGYRRELDSFDKAVLAVGEWANRHRQSPRLLGPVTADQAAGRRTRVARPERRVPVTLGRETASSGGTDMSDTNTPRSRLALPSGSDGRNWVFAYGSNMATDDLRSRILATGGREDGLARVEAATLSGYRLIWNYRSKSRDGGAANVEPYAGQDLPGVALLVDADVLRAIDRKEGHPHFYDRGQAPLRVRLGGGDEVDAWVYVARPERRSATPTLPRRAYLQLLIDGARLHGLPMSHIAELQAMPTAD